ncbi:MAG: universal stress protein [Acidimicrobiales bacterium]|nr:universal stress protein [Acidimicrobiales bacterium]RZV46946.1 MAG: universal stress protein [Acidimicrobiales bacterium]
MKFVVVGLDGSECSRNAFHEAMREAVWRGAEVHAVHSVHYPAMIGLDYTPLDLNDLRVAGKQMLSDELAELEKSYDGGFPTTVEPVVTMGHVGVQVMMEACPEEGEHADLVVVGSRGMGGFRGLLLGSVSTYLAHHLPARLLIVRAND